MSSNKLNNLIEKYNLSNIIKIILILLLLFLVYRIFIESNIRKNTFEGFTQGTLTNDNIYGNVIPLNDTKNIPMFSGKTCILKLNDTYRIDTLVFNFAMNTNTNPNITISFIDDNGNVKYLKGNGSIGSPPEFSSNNLVIYNISDENDLLVYTSELTLTLLGESSTFDDTTLTSFGIYGGESKLPSLVMYKELCSNLTNNSMPISSIPPRENSVSDSYTFKQEEDTLIYSIELEFNEINTTNSTTSPFNIKITYENSLYNKDIFTINTSYTVRCDKYTDSTTKTYIFLTEPIIANKVIFTVSKVNTSINPSALVKLNIKKLNVLDKTPNDSELSNYKESINTIISNKYSKNNTNTTKEVQDNVGEKFGNTNFEDLETRFSSNLCPSIDDLKTTQEKSQKICDNLEYQDKIKSEKLRLERNKQYLLKLKDQQDQIEQLNSAIQDLEDKRASRALSADQVRVLQYQKQKADSSTIRDLANQRLDSQANNQLYMDVNFSS